VLRGQCVRSGGGLYYDDVDEFCEGLFRLEASGPMGAALGRHGAPTTTVTTRGP
jgi:hypothetical protein